MQHQDWNTVVLNPKKTSDANNGSKLVRPPPAVTSVSGKLARKIEDQVDSDTGKPVTYISTKDKQDIINLRTKAKLTRDQLAQLVNLNIKVITDIETGKAIENKAMISKIKQKLTTYIDKNNK